MALSLGARIEPLAWESHFFSVASAMVRCDDAWPLLTAQRMASWSRLQAKVPAWRADWLDPLQRLGFQLVEGEIDLTLAVGAPGESDAEIATDDDIPVLRQQAAQVFVQSRFRPPWYTPPQRAQFYAQWIENAVRGTFDHQCLVLRGEGGEIRAFVSLRQLNHSEARIGLLAGRGAGATLLAAARRWAWGRQLTTVRVATQMGNTAALKRYIASGANVDSAAYWLYR